MSWRRKEPGYDFFKRNFDCKSTRQKLSQYTCMDVNREKSHISISCNLLLITELHIRVQYRCKMCMMNFYTWWTENGICETVILKNLPKIQILKFRKTLCTWHIFLTCLIICKYEMDSVNIVEDTDRVATILSTARQMDIWMDVGQTYKVKPVYPGFNFVEAWGILKAAFPFTKVFWQCHIIVVPPTRSTHAHIPSTWVSLTHINIPSTGYQSMRLWELWCADVDIWWSATRHQSCQWCHRTLLNNWLGTVLLTWINFNPSMDK